MKGKGKVKTFILRNRRQRQFSDRKRTTLIQNNDQKRMAYANSPGSSNSLFNIQELDSSSKNGSALDESELNESLADME